MVQLRRSNKKASSRSFSGHKIVSSSVSFRYWMRSIVRPEDHSQSVFLGESWPGHGRNQAEIFLFIILVCTILSNKFCNDRKLSSKCAQILYSRAAFMCFADHFWPSGHGLRNPGLDVFIGTRINHWTNTIIQIGLKINYQLMLQDNNYIFFGNPHDIYPGSIEMNIDLRHFGA